MKNVQSSRQARGAEAARPVLEFLQSLRDADAVPPALLSPSDGAAVKGTYIFGISASQRVDVTIDRGQPTWARPGMMGRPLFHLGNRVFYPWGAPSVRIRFSGEDESVTMTINDPDIVLIARRKQAPQ
jgi:hypothetical protein